MHQLFEEEWTRESVVAWLKEHWDGDFAVDDPPKPNLIAIKDGKVRVGSSVHLRLDGKPLPFKFYGLHDYHFSLFDPGSLVGCPEVVSGRFDLWSEKEISFDGAPESVGVDTQKTYVTIDVPSLKNIHKHIKYFNGKKLLLSNNVRKNVLGILLIKGVREVKSTTSAFVGAIENLDKLNAVVDVLNDNLGKPNAVVKAQRELMNYADDHNYEIEFDLDDYAEL